MSWLCTRCLEEGAPRRPPRGTLLVELLLWLFLCWTVVIPLGYSLWRFLSRDRECRTCGARTLVPSDSRAAERLLGLDEEADDWDQDIEPAPIAG